MIYDIYIYICSCSPTPFLCAVDVDGVLPTASSWTRGIWRVVVLMGMVSLMLVQLTYVCRLACPVLAAGQAYTQHSCGHDGWHPANLGGARGGDCRKGGGCAVALSASVLVLAGTHHTSICA
jgi:hypothetical protein